MIRCAECNEENMDGLEYCDSCGAKLEVVAGDSEGAPAEAETAEEAPAEVEASEEVSEASCDETVAEAAEAADEAAEAAGEEAPVSTSADTGDLAEDAQAAPSDSPSAAGTASLTITRGGTVGKVFELQSGDNLVGRWDPDSGSFPEVDMENDDPEARISRKHALIKFGDDLTIEDMGSLNGTFVNRGQRLEPGSPATLKDGDEIIIGKTFFTVSMAS